MDAIVDGKPGRVILEVNEGCTILTEDGVRVAVIWNSPRLILNPTPAQLAETRARQAVKR